MTKQNSTARFDAIELSLASADNLLRILMLAAEQKAGEDDGDGFAESTREMLELISGHITAAWNLASDNPEAMAA